MSQFDFPRINFHGTALLDTATANNGNYEPALTLFDQDRSLPYMPPRCYYPPNPNFGPPPGVPIITDKNGNPYSPILPVNADNYQQWATTPLGQFPADAAYLQFYENLQISGKMPGYWNYYGDLSMTLENVLVTGITVPDNTAGTVTYSPQNSNGCPPDLAPILNGVLSFNYNYFDLGSRTSAFLCDVDSMGQMCTQIFCGTAGLYNKDGSNTSFFTGNPGKSSARWMNLTRVLNWVNMVPMGGSASFYCMIQLDAGSPIAAIFEQYTGQAVTCLFMKLLIHEVYEVRNPDYGTIPTKKINDNQGNPVEIPKNPAIVSVTGSLTPWNANDLMTAPLSRILKATTPLALNIDGIPDPVPLPQNTSQPIGVCSSVTLGPVHFVHNTTNNLLSLDLTNTINEYGINPGPFPVFAGVGDIQPFTEFVNYDYGPLSLNFQPDNGSAPVTVYTITYESNYNMAQLLATGGMVDIQVPVTSYAGGYFYLSVVQSNVTVMQEDDVYMTTDQQGIYAEQNQVPADLYLSDGLPRVPFLLSVLYRGTPVSQANPVNVVLQAINMSTYASTQVTLAVYDGMDYTFPVATDGCMTYVFAYNPADLFTFPPSFAGIAAFAMRAYIVVLRVLSEELKLKNYLNGELPITWQVIFDNIFVLYKTLYPVMDAILPMIETNWDDPLIQSKLIELTDEKNWNQPLFMPVTRDMTAAQRQLLNMWVQQSSKS
jgi:hypothetical protein